MIQVEKDIPNPSMAKGHAYEIKAALNLHKKGHNIKGIGVEIKGKHAKREFDIVTDKSLIECKAWDWGRMKEDKKQNFGDKKMIADEYGLDFIVYSKTSITDQMKKWFIKKNIKFVEE